ncbi:MAG: hypothetical protein COV34_02480 [Candidatus Zambryskibacteria bacterium CG10_big_fil_rev_8_21_14_0_10_42_12]|uniref:Uncharacterized protein n=1 Tax=Candidatus Zambryskibacteria bacterium CG10_big_fil_rev_8_21_14_0_10_42_12 TaxID=1975115 RepID=A0A2H0QUG8_9BACT|nr:MAG: hypothetical protein COV34_02480 [Candidatus Zambryskibacteria bacterium CG10_big_fil_rev_8_21_14_0_10_42_12]
METFFTQSNLLVLLGTTCAVFILVSIIFYYHWRKYSDRTEVMVLAETIYLSVGALLFAGALIVIGIL